MSSRVIPYKFRCRCQPAHFVEACDTARLIAEIRAVKLERDRLAISIYGRCAALFAITALLSGAFLMMF